MEVPAADRSELKKACVNCGAELVYKPGTTEINCEYCGHQKTIHLDPNGFEELELYPYLKRMGGQSHTQEISLLNCKNCGANQHVEENYKSLNCVYCSAPLIREDMYTEEWILPGAVLPFQLAQKEAHKIFKEWILKMWWAPNKLKKAIINPEITKGLYLPYWTFDAQLRATYTGQRGDYYYETEYYRDQDGKRRSRQVRKTRWRRASGKVGGFVDDTLIKASRQQKQKRIPKKVAWWNLDKLQPFTNDFLSGFVTEKYTVSLEQGHLLSQEEAERIADRWSRHDIGGDEQRVHTINMKLSEETFKHVLLPVYISAYRFKGKEYNFFINGETGKIAGKRPYSPWKIGFAILVAILCILLLSFLAQAYG
ncbi:MAG: hypothetical protein KTR13_09250 [Saprospiraceae bacterium]|nr:hypothetical protein [Saprospiraceae bacterium]